MGTLKRHLPFSGEEGLQELKKIAISSEEKIYSAATSQSDNPRKISLKMLTMAKSQNNVANSLPFDSAINRNSCADAATDNNNYWRPSQGAAEPAMDIGDWRTQLQNESRQRIVKKIMDALKRPFLVKDSKSLKRLP